MPYPPREGDLTINQLAQRAIPVMLAGSTVYIKWTCPSCGERVTMDDPLSFNDDGQLVVPSHVLHTTKDDDSPCMHSVPIEDGAYGMVLVSQYTKGPYSFKLDERTRL